MNDLFNQPPVSTNLGTGNPLQPVSGPLPGSGIVSFVKNLLSPKPMPSLIQGSPSLFPSGFGSVGSLPGGGPLASLSAGMPSLPTPAPTAAPKPVTSSPLIPTAQAATIPGATPAVNAGGYPLLPNGQPNYPAFTDAQWLSYQANKPPVTSTPTPTLADLMAQVTALGKQINSPSFSLKTSGDVTSSQLGSNYSMGDINRMIEERARQLAGNSQYIPTNSSMDSLNGTQWPSADAYGQALYDYNGATKDLLTRQFDLRRQIQGLQEDGAVTQEQAKGFIDEANRRANIELADITNRQTGAALTMGVFKPMEVSPGSSLVTPFGQTIYQGTGAAPAQIATYAQQLKQNDQITGQVHIDPTTGAVDDNYYYQMAQAQLSGRGGSSGSIDTSGGSGITTGGTVTGAYGSGGFGSISALPPTLQKYVINPSLTTPSGEQSLPFIQAERIPSGLQDTAKSYAQAAGIPYLDQAGANTVYAAQQILQIADAARALSIRNLGSGVTGRITNSMKAWANNFLQFNPDLSNFNQLRDAASKATTALAGGVGSGFRMNMGIIDSAVQNLPTASDNLETALAKADALSTQIINGLSPVFPYLNNPNLLNAKGGQGAQGGQIDWNSII